MVLFNKFGLHQPLNRQSKIYADEGMSISVSTLADYVGHGTVLLRGLVDLIEAHILAGERIHHNDTTVPVMAAGKTITGRIWATVRDDRPFGGTDPPRRLVLLYPRPVPATSRLYTLRHAAKLLGEIEDAVSNAAISMFFRGWRHSDH